MFDFQLIKKYRQINIIILLGTINAYFYNIFIQMNENNMT